MKVLRGTGNTLRKHAGLCVTLIASILLIAIIAIWVLSPVGLWAIRDYGLLLAAVVAFPLAFWRSRVAERQADAAHRQVEAAQSQVEAAHRQVEAAQQDLMNERYQKGAEMLGSDVLSVRLGGIYALQRLAVEHPQQYHIQIMQLLCAYARHPTRDESEAAVGEEVDPPTELRQDVQAVLTAISSCHASQLELERTAGFHLDIRSGNLSHADLVHANLSGADLRKTDLSCADLSGADLSDAELLATTFSQAELWRANLSRADLRDANLHGTILREANLRDAILAKANLSGADLKGADMSQANLISVILTQAILVGANLTKAVLWNADLLGANIRDANLSNTQFSTNTGHRSQTVLTQEQLNTSRADPANPPKLDDVRDAITSEPLVWRSKPLEENA